MIRKWKMKAKKCRGGERLRYEMMFRNVVSSPKHKLVAKVDLVQDWMRYGKMVKHEKGGK